MALALISNGLAVALYDAGWKLDAPPGEAVTLHSDGRRIEPFKVVWELGEGELSAEDWRTRCAELGIAGLPLRALGQPGATGAPEPSVA